MARKRVLIGLKAYPVMAQAIADAVRLTPDLELVESPCAGSDDDLAAQLDVQALAAVDVLVLLGELRRLDTSLLIARHPALRVLHVRMREHAAQINLRGLDLRQLVALLRVLVGNDLPEPQQRHVVLELPSTGAQAAQHVQPYEAAEPPWPQVRQWIDAVLSLYRVRQPASEAGVQGVALPPQALDEALALRGGPGPVAEQALQRLVRAEAALDEVLLHPDASSSPLAALVQRLELTPLELRAVLLCLAPETDFRFQRVFGLLHDDLGRRIPSLGLVCALLGDDCGVRQALLGSGGLQRWALLESGARGLPGGEDLLRLDAPLCSWLLGDAHALLADPVLQPLLRQRPWPGADWLGSDEDGVQLQALVRALGDAPPALLVLDGADTEGWRALLEAAAQQAGRLLLRLQLDPATQPQPGAAEDMALRLARAARLLHAWPVIDASAGSGAVDAPVLAALAAGLGAAAAGGALLVADLQAAATATAAYPAAVLRRDPPDAAQRHKVLGLALKQAGLRLPPQGVQRLAAGFELGLAQVDAALRTAGTLGADAASAPREAERLLAEAVRRTAAPTLSRFAQRLQASFTLDDVVLPGAQQAQLREIVAQVRHAPQVLQDWEFGASLPYGRGIAVVFAGPSGTGKTMAAQAVAHALDTELFAVDLSRVVSKYIGETEKHLDAVFDDAQRAGAVLLFDEADALFGRRSEVKDAHDRYANIEVAYLLQRMEAFSGLAILTTNLQRNLDPAFLRRLRFVVSFPRPDASAREAIWRLCLPTAAPLGEDVDLGYMAARFELSGGSIRQVTLHAAFLAAQEEAASIGMRHVLAATQAELRKLGMSGAERELAAYARVQRHAAAGDAA